MLAKQYRKNKNELHGQGGVFVVVPVVFFNTPVPFYFILKGTKVFLMLFHDQFSFAKSSLLKGKRHTKAYCKIQASIIRQENLKLLQIILLKSK